MKQTIVYDFDKTLTYADTLFGFFRYASKKNIFYIGKLSIYIFCMILSKLHIITNSQLKTIGIKLFLMNLSKITLEKKFKDYHSKIKFNKTFYSLNYNQNINYYIVSASFQEYIKPIFPDYVNVIGSTIKFKNNQAYSLDYNCYKENKALALKNFQVNQINVLFTDSYSDLALASISKQIIIIDKDNQIICNNLNEFKRYFKK